MDRPASLASEGLTEAGVAPAVHDAVMRTTPNRIAQQLLFFVFTEHLLVYPCDFSFIPPADYETVAKAHIDYLLLEKPQQFKAPMARTFCAYLLNIFRMFPPISPAPTPHDSPPSPSGKKRRQSTSPTPTQRRCFPRKYHEIAADHPHLWAFLCCIVDASKKSSIACVCGKTQHVEQGYNYFTHIRDKCSSGKEPPLFVAPTEAAGRQVRSPPSAEELRMLAEMSADMMSNLPSSVQDALRAALAVPGAGTSESHPPRAETQPLVAPVPSMPPTDLLVANQELNFLADDADPIIK